MTEKLIENNPLIQEKTAPAEQNDRPFTSMEGSALIHDQEAGDLLLAMGAILTCLKLNGFMLE